MQSISLLAIPNQELNALLGDQECTIQVRQIGERLYLSLWVDDTAIAQNAIILPRVPVLPGGAAGFEGNFLMVDTQSKWEAQGIPDWEGLGERYMLYYVTAEDFS